LQNAGGVALKIKTNSSEYGLGECIYLFDVFQDSYMVAILTTSGSQAICITG
jgi:hypothetical protein